MDALYSKSLKAGDRTYFIDVKEAKNASKYLTIAESRRSKEDEKKFTRSSVMIFANQVEQFQEAISEAMDLIRK